MADIKWSAFPNDGAITTGDLIVGLRSGVNAQFTGNTFDNLMLAGNTLSSVNTNGNMVFQSNGTGSYLFGQSGGVNPGLVSNAVISVGSPGVTPGNIGSYSYTANTTAAILRMSKSRSSSIGTFVALQANDTIGNITFIADTGTTFSTRTSISSVITSVGAFLASNLRFFTSGAASASNFLALTLNSDQSATFSGLIIPNSILGIQGTTTNDSANAGSVGELNSTVVLTGSAVSLTSTIASNIATLVLQPGDYDVWAEVWFNANAATVIASLDCGLNTVSATIPTTPSVSTSRSLLPITLGAGLAPVINLKACRITVATATTTTVYLTVNSTFSVNTLSGYGVIMARRPR